MAQKTSRVEFRAPAAPLPSERPAGLAEAHPCPVCASTTLALADVLRSAQSGDLTPALRKALPNVESASRWLRPPDLPSETAAVRFDIWGNSFSLAILIFVVLLASVMFGAIVGYLYAIPIAVVLLGYGLHWIRKTSSRPKTVVSSAEHERALALRAWDRRMEVWERLAICPKCGLLSDPVTGRTAEWHSVPSLFV